MKGNGLSRVEWQLYGSKCLSWVTGSKYNSSRSVGNGQLSSQHQLEKYDNDFNIEKKKNPPQKKQHKHFCTIVCGGGGGWWGWGGVSGTFTVNKDYCTREETVINSDCFGICGSVASTRWQKFVKGLIWMWGIQSDYLSSFSYSGCIQFWESG